MKPSATFGLMVASGGAVAPFAQSRCLRSLQSLATTTAPTMCPQELPLWWSEWGASPLGQASHSPTILGYSRRSHRQSASQRSTCGQSGGRPCIRPWQPPLAAIGTLPHQHGPMVRVGGIRSNQCLLPAGHSLEIVEWLTP